MSAVYWVLASDELMDSDPLWPAFLRPVEPGPYEHPGMRWWKFEDDEAPESLNGKRIELTSWRDGDEVRVARRPAI